MDQKKTIRPFSMKDKIGYTLGDLGCCFTEQYRAMYLSIFYTLILQVNPFHVGILLLITKIWDAVNDPIIGALVDSRKATKGGKFIPWIRAFSFPMAVLCILGFVNVGNINYGLRLAYMFVTYVLYEALYTCVNVPFGTLSSVMTDDVSQRTALSRYRSLGGTIFMTVMVMVGPLFLYVDNQPVAGRFLMLACICAMLGLLCLQITCVWCKERVEVPERPQGEKLNYLHVLKEISHNKALLGVMFFSLTGMIGASVVNGLNTYLYKDFFGNVKIQAVSGMLSVLYAVLSFAITQPLANKFGKKEWCCMGAGFAAIVFGILFFFPVHNPVAFIVINGICYLGGRSYSKSIEFFDVNYQLAQPDDQTAIFEYLCDLYNYLDASIHVQLTFVNRKTDREQLAQSFEIPLCGDGLDHIRQENTGILKRQLERGNNGNVKTKYLTFGIEAANMKEAKPIPLRPTI